VSDPAHPREVSSVRLGGIVSRAARPAAPAQRLAGAPQMVEISRDGRRIYLTNSLYGAWDDQFYPDGVGAWMARIDADPTSGGLTVDPGISLTTTTPAADGSTRSASPAATLTRTLTATGAEGRTPASRAAPSAYTGAAPRKHEVEHDNGRDP
jgi:hypothetical protein